MNPYDLLGLLPTASPDEIRAAYRRRAAVWHPDRHPTEKKAEAVERMVHINAARDLLLDPRRRIQYHREHEDALRWKMAQAVWEAQPGQAPHTNAVPNPAPRRRSWAFIYEQQRRQQRQRFYQQLLVSLVAIGLLFGLGLSIALELAGDTPAVQEQKTAIVAAITLWTSLAGSFIGLLGFTLLLTLVMAGLGRIFRR